VSDPGPEVCPDCGARSVETSLELDEFEFGFPPVLLFATIELHHCRACAFKFTSASAEVARDEAVSRYLSTLKVNAT
jgi:hypothetical protein